MEFVASSTRKRNNDNASYDDDELSIEDIKARIKDIQAKKTRRNTSTSSEEKEPKTVEFKKAMKDMGAMEDGDAVFGCAAEVESNSWHDGGKYELRKPKYYNRVHAGYEWNKYNQTHYDHDNPPPKMVRGYKFNIFYPDLIDKSVTPECRVERDGNSTDTCIIRFHAGPPYQDIAFRIVKDEWESSPNKGYRCRFDGGILQVYFNFKRFRYRR